MNEAAAMSQWLYETLAAAPAVTDLVRRSGEFTGLYEDLAPQDAPLPYVVWTHNSGRVTRSVGADRRGLVRSLWALSCYAEDGSLTADLLAAAVDAALAGAKGTLTVDGSNYWVASAQMEEPLRLTEIGPGGRRILRRGGLYKIIGHGLP